jgi:hypothetical protein
MDLFSHLLDQSTHRGKATRPTDRTPRARVSRSDPARLREPKCSRVRRMSPHELIDLVRPTHVSQPFSVFAQSFGTSVSDFLVSLSNLVIVNSTIFGIVNSFILVIMNSVILATRVQSFYDFVSHSTKELSHFSLL